MGLFKKKEVKKEVDKLPELPDLPELPKLPDLSELQQKTPSQESSLPKPPRTEQAKILETKENLPSFPGFGTGEDLSPKTPPILPEDIRNEPPFKERKSLEISETGPKFPGMTPSMLSGPIPTKITKKVEPVYIRIDKFKSAVNSFQEIQNKILEIEALLVKIRETKQKEDAELREWEREIETIKARIGAIDQNIFSKLD